MFISRKYCKMHEATRIWMVTNGREYTGVCVSGMKQEKNKEIVYMGGVFRKRNSFRWLDRAKPMCGNLEVS